MQLSKTLKFFVIFLVVFIAACYADKSKDPTIAKLQSEAAHITLLNRNIMAYGVEILHTDDAMMLLLPVKRFFNPSSANFTVDAYSCLDQIIELLSHYETAVIHVSGYADCNCCRSKLLAEAQAQKVAKYLWDNKIDASLIYADGHDAALVRKEKCILADYVIISLRKLPKY